MYVSIFLKSLTACPENRERNWVLAHPIIMLNFPCTLKISIKSVCSKADSASPDNRKDTNTTSSRDLVSQSLLTFWGRHA